MNALFLGVDAGNTKTIAAVADRKGNILSTARGGLGDIYGVDAAEEATGEVLRLVDQALQAARATHPEYSDAPLASAAFRLAGVDWPEDRELWEHAIRSHLGPGAPFSVKNDGFALLRCGDPDGVGVAVSLGTGGAIAGRGRRGEEFAVSWWIQHGLGAAGLVDEALKAIYLAEIGMAPATRLAHALPAFYGAASVEDLLHQFTRRHDRGGSHLHKSTAARTVLKEAEQGDPVARRIVEGHSERVCDYIAACARRVGLRTDEPFTVTLGGSVIGADGLVRAATLTTLRQRLPHTRIATCRSVPILGTILDALAEDGVAVDSRARDSVLGANLGF